jgi:hypothetical protein
MTKSKKAKVFRPNIERATWLVTGLFTVVVGCGDRRVVAISGDGPMDATSGSDWYYVGGPNADDTNPGTSAQPFATISKCASVALAGETCHIREGVYRETVIPAHSGVAAAPITFAAVSGVQVTIDGTDAVSGWTLDSGSVYAASVQLSGTAAQPYSSTQYPSNEELWANQVFGGTTMVQEAAYPAPSSDIWVQNYTAFSATSSSSDTCITPPCTTIATGTLSINGAPALGDMTGAIALFAGGWVALSAIVTSGSLDSSMNISFPVSDAKVYPGGGNDSKLRLVGKKGFLSAENQWYYDAGAEALYLWAVGGVPPDNVRAKKRNYGFDLRGKNYVNIANITLFATTIATDDSSSNISLDGIRGQFLSHWQTAQYDSTLPYAGIYDSNHRLDSGVLLHGSNNVLKNSVLHLSAGNGVSLRGSGHTVDNCNIYDVGYAGTYAAAVTIEVGSHDAKILNNTLYSAGRDAVNMTTNAYPNPGYLGIEIGYNNIYDYARLTNNSGGVFACCDTSLAGGRIHHNWVHEPDNLGNGFKFDNGTYDIAVDHNVLWGLLGCGISWGGHTNRPPTGSSLPYLKGTVYNNTIISGTNDTICNYFAAAAQVANMTVRNNILDGYHVTGQNFGYIAGGTPVEDHNLVTLYSVDGSGTSPGYSNPAVFDLTLRSTSPAIDSGIGIPGITDGYVGTAPDQGAYEFGQATWVAGATPAP